MQKGLVASLGVLAVVLAVVLAWAVADYQAVRSRFHRAVIQAMEQPAQADDDKALAVFHNAAAWSFFNELKAAPPDVVYFADSVMGGHTDDEDRATLAELLGRALGQPVRAVSGAGFTAVVFTEYAALLPRAPHPPRLAVLAVNPRSLCDGWFFSKDYSYEGLASFLRLLADEPDAWRWLASLPGGRLRGAGGGLADKSKAADHGQAVAAYFAAKRRDLSAFSAAPSGATPQEEAIRRHFLENYMSVDVAPGHPMLGALRQTVARLRSAGVRVLAYVTPVDVDEGERLAGPAFRAMLGQDAAQVVRVLSAEGAVCVDYSQLLESACFVDREYACEHLNLAGRTRLAQALASEIKRQGLAPGR